MGWDTPINAAFVTKRAPEGRLFMGFSVQDRVDLADPDAVARAVNAHLPEATVVTSDGHDWVRDPFSKGTWLATPPGWFGDGTFEVLETPQVGSRSPARTSRPRAPGGSKGRSGAG